MHSILVLYFHLTHNNICRPLQAGEEEQSSDGKAKPRIRVKLSRPLNQLLAQLSSPGKSLYTYAFNPCTIFPSNSQQYLPIALKYGPYLTIHHGAQSLTIHHGAQSTHTISLVLDLHSRVSLMLPPCLGLSRMG